MILFMSKQKIRGLDMFSGAGGSSAGATAAGVEMVGAIDMCPVATQTYGANFNNAVVKNGRIEEIDLRRFHDEIGDIDIILSSPECTNHSCAKGGAPRDEASKATALQVIRYAREFEPRWVVLENVINMRPWSRYVELKNTLSEIGYHLAEQVLDASNFRVPQARRRLFLVGDRKGMPKEVKQKTPTRKRTVKAILDRPGKWRTSPLRAEKRAEDTLARAERAIAQLGEGLPFLIVYYGSDGSGGWQPLDRPLRTVTTLDRFALVTPTDDGYQMRMLQVPELKRAMGFDGGYKLPYGSRRDRIRLLGNGVCPPVMEAVVSHLVGG